MASIFTSAYKLLAHGTPNWDTQLRADMTLLETSLAQQAWAPGFGGTGASLGSSSGTNGYASRNQQLATYVGRLVFGTGASFGSGTPVITNLNSFSSDLDPSNVVGDGYYLRAGTSYLIPVQLFPVSGSTFQPFLLNGSGQMVSPTSIGFTPASSDQLKFRVVGLLSA